MWSSRDEVDLAADTTKLGSLVNRPSRDNVLERQADTSVNRHLFRGAAARVQPREHFAQLRRYSVRTDADSPEGTHLDSEHSIVADEQGVANHGGSHFRLARLIGPSVVTCVPGASIPARIKGSLAQRGLVNTTRGLAYTGIGDGLDGLHDHIRSSDDNSRANVAARSGTHIVDRRFMEPPKGGERAKLAPSLNTGTDDSDCLRFLAGEHVRGESARKSRSHRRKVRRVHHRKEFPGLKAVQTQHAAELPGSDPETSRVPSLNTQGCQAWCPETRRSPCQVPAVENGPDVLWPPDWWSS